MGFRRVLLVTGESPPQGPDYIMRSVRAIYKHTGIRIVHVNAPPMEVDEFRSLKESGVGVFQVFQETYHRPTYELAHPAGRKRDYDYRLWVMDRAIKAGFEDVGIGALLGLYDYRFDVLSTIAHSRHLFSSFKTHAHTISIPRLRPARGARLKPFHYKVSDWELKKITAIYRVSVPCAGIVVSTRERGALRGELIHAGASQFSAASRTEPGGYAGLTPTLKQFSTSDRRTLLDVMVSILKEGSLPSLCTTCYRVGRTGRSFTEIASSEKMGRFCQANAILTLKEYLLDNELNGLCGLFEEAIEKNLSGIKEHGLKEKVSRKLEELKKGERDIYL